MGRLGWLTTAVVLLVATPLAAAPIHYTVDAELDLAARAIAGTVAMRIDAPASLGDQLTLALYPNRFASEDPGVNDLTRRFVYPREEFVAGGMEVGTITVQGPEACGDPLTVDPPSEDTIGAWPRTLLRLRLPATLDGAGGVVVRVPFRTTLPVRYGPLGAVDGGVTALAAWFPFLVREVAPPGAEPYLQPLTAPVAGRVVAPRAATVVLGGRVDAAGAAADPACDAAPIAADWRATCFDGARAPGPALLADPGYRTTARTVGATEVVYVERKPSWLAYAIPPLPPRAEVVLPAVERVLQGWPAGLPSPPARLVVTEAPLRLELTAVAGPGVVVVSDRVLRAHRLVRELHERVLAAAVYEAALVETVAVREQSADVPWIAEGLAATLADEHAARVRADGRSLYDWLRALRFLALVDDFEAAPKIPFGRSVFPDHPHLESLDDDVEGLLRDRPAGRTIIAKLRNVVGDDALGAIRARYLARHEPWRETVAAVHGESLDWLFAQWTRPPPRLNYAVADVRGGDGAPVELRLAREASRPVREPVEVEVAGRGDQGVRLVWDDDRREATFTVDEPMRVRRVRLDPDRKLVEETRVDNAHPRPWQVVVGGADVTVTSSEFAVGALLVARRRHDYRKDVGLVGFASDRAAGLLIGPRWHFGAPVDASRYRHNLYTFYTAAALRGDFEDDTRPGVRTDGTVAGLGFRYDYGPELLPRNPTSGVKLRIFGDWYHDAVGSDFDYVDGGIRARVVQRLATHRTLVAAEVLNAFSAPIGGDVVPNQGRFSLGGDRAVRGIPVDERLGESIVLVRAELRQKIYPDLDWNLFDFLVLRHHQLRLFVDAGRVSDRRSTLYRVSDFAVGAGIGVALVYDFLGFHPGVFYVAAARRLDHESGATNGVQILFGTSQAF